MNGVGRTTIVRAAYNMAEVVVWLQERCKRVCVVGRCTYRVVGVCPMVVEHIRVDVERPVGRLDYRFVVADAISASSDVAFSYMGHSCSV